MEEHSRVAFRVRPSPNGGFEAYDVEVLERAAAAGSVAVGMRLRGSSGGGEWQLWDPPGGG